MSCYLIGIGGTGAKCIEAATHLSAAGLLPESELYTLFVDPDESNGNLEQAKVTLDRHIEGQKMTLGSAPLFQTRVRRANPSVWSPFGESSGSELQLRSSFSYSQMRAQDEEIAGLFDVLYSDDEKNADLAVGFRGHPSIGAAVMAQQLSLSETEPWITFRRLVSNDAGTGDKAHIFLCGSVFGGTGAAGLPTIGKLVRQELESGESNNFEIACGLVLPYFSFEGTPEDEDIKAEAKSFVPNAQAALNYYWNKRHDDIFDGMYVVGDPAMSSVGDASVGGPTQENKPHFVELMIALGAADFFEKGTGTGQVALMSRSEDKSLDWDDLPYPHSSELRQKLSQLVHFSFAYLSTYKPALDAIRSGERGSYAFPWYVDLVEQAGVSLHDDRAWKQFENVEAYARRFLRWTAEMHETASQTEISLFDCTAFSYRDPESGEIALRDERGFQRKKFSLLDRPASDSETNELSNVWNRLSSTSTPEDTGGAGSFIQALHKACNPDNFSA